MSKINERQSFERNYETIGTRSKQRNMQGSIKRINYRKVNRILMIIISIFIIFSVISGIFQKVEKNQMIEKYEQSEVKLKEEIEQLKVENASLQTRLEDEENQFDFLFDKFLQTYFQDQKQTE